MSKYELFLFDLDDTLFDFRASEEHSFFETLSHFNIVHEIEKIFETYKVESYKLWQLLEQGKISKDFLRTERFQKTMDAHQLESCPIKLSDIYLEHLTQTVHHIDGAEDICEHLSQEARIGIITNGIEFVQHKRLAQSPLKKYVDFVVVSEECGYAKPHAKFFEHTMDKGKILSKDSVLVIGDRLETDILGANDFGLDSCWFNPHGKAFLESHALPKFNVACLSEIKDF